MGVVRGVVSDGKKGGGEGWQQSVQGFPLVIVIDTVITLRNAVFLW